MRSIRKIALQAPVARGEGLLVQDVGQETVVYDTESNQAHCLSPLAAVVFHHADGHRSLAQLTEVASSHLGLPVEVAAVREAVVQLEASRLVATPAGTSRRDFIRRSTVAGAAWAVPLITTIIAPTAHAAASEFCVDTCRCCTNQGQCVGRSCNCTAATGAEIGSHCKPANAAVNCQHAPCP